MACGMGILNNSDATLLFDADGAIASNVIRAHNDRFTVDFLRHTILGEKLADAPLTAPLLLHESRNGLIVAPTEQELSEYVAKPNQKTIHSAAPEEAIPVQDTAVTQQRFLRHFNRAHIGHSLKAMIELQRSAITLQMEAVLDAAQANDEKAFATSQDALEVTIRVGRKILGAELKELGIGEAEQQDYLLQMMQSAVISAMRNRMNATQDKQDREVLCDRYENLLTAHRRAQQKAEASEFEGALKKKSGKPAPSAHVYTPTVTLQGKRLYPPRHPMPHSAANDCGRGV